MKNTEYLYDDVTEAKLELIILEMAKYMKATFVEDLGNGLYQIGDFVTGRLGLEAFDRAIKEELIKLNYDTRRMEILEC